MIGRTVTSIVILISCKIILVISQRQAPFRQFIRTHAIFLLVILMVKMFSRIKSIRSNHLSLYKKGRAKTLDHPFLKMQPNNLRRAPHTLRHHQVKVHNFVI